MIIINVTVCELSPGVNNGFFLRKKTLQEWKPFKNNVIYIKIGVCLLIYNIFCCFLKSKTSIHFSAVDIFVYFDIIMTC